MSARDELMQDIRSIDGPALLGGDVLADGLLALGYRKPKQVTTAEELDALPEDTVIRTAGHGEFAPRVAVKSLRFDSGVSYWHIADADDFESTSDELDDLPATVLYEPEGGA